VSDAASNELEYFARCSGPLRRAPERCLGTPAVSVGQLNVRFGSLAEVSRSMHQVRSLRQTGHSVSFTSAVRQLLGKVMTFSAARNSMVGYQ
jgi:hypothetical protein